MTAPTPWLGTEPSDVPEIDLDDEGWLRTPPWWFRLSPDWNWTTDDIDRVCGPEYRMNWEML